MYGEGCCMCVGESMNGISNVLGGMGVRETGR